MNTKELSSKRVAVLGYGIEGRSVVKWLRAGGVGEITVYDEKTPEPSTQTMDIDIRYGPFPDLSVYDAVIHSPGIRPDIPVLVAAKETGKTVTTATNIFMDLACGKIIGVTGTKGKGTTSTLIHEMLLAHGKDSHIGGNIGIPPLEFLSLLTQDSISVLELSSFQLMSMTKSPHIAVILMVTSEHLDFHPHTDEYLWAKAGIVRYQGMGDMTVVNIDYPHSRIIAESSSDTPYEVSTMREVGSGVMIRDGSLWWVNQGKATRILPLADIRIPGAHNWENAGAASAAAILLDVPIATIRRVLTSFKGLEHRLEPVSDGDGIRYYNDSFSTTPETAIAAIKAFSQPKVLILGGSSKKSDFSTLGKVIRESPSIRGIVGIGEEWNRIRQAIGRGERDIPVIEGCTTMDDMVAAARSLAQPGDVVLLTPACASFGLFKNYKVRGIQFREEVMKLLEGKG